MAGARTSKEEVGQVLEVISASVRICTCAACVSHLHAGSSQVQLTDAAISGMGFLQVEQQRHPGGTAVIMRRRRARRRLGNLEPAKF